MQAKRLYISADIEGTAGVVSKEQLGPEGFEYQQAREWMTAEVNAACEAAFECGIEEVVVSDSHGNGQNLLLEKLPHKVQVVRSWPRPLGMMEGIDVGDYEGALLLGYHSGASDLRGVLAHTLSGAGITEVRLNGEVASETVISAAIAAHFAVPVMLVSGDDAYIEHAQQVLAGPGCPLEGVLSKWASSATSARMIAPKVVQQDIAAGVRAVLGRRDEFIAAPLSPNIELQVNCLRRRSAELLDFLPNVQRVDAYTVQWVGKDMVEISKILAFLLASGVLTFQ